MMIRVIQAATILIVATTGCVVAFCIGPNVWGPDAASDAQTSQSIVTAFKAARAQGPEAKKRVSPLVTQARALAQLLNPPPPPAPKRAVAPKRKVVAPKPVPPVQVSAKFMVHATSYNETDPAKSIALIGEVGRSDQRRWVRQGSQIGHFVIQEIRPGSLICSVGQELREIALERDPTPSKTVAGLRGASSPSGPRMAAVGDVPAPRPDVSPRRPRRANRRTVGNSRARTVD